MCTHVCRLCWWSLVPGGSPASCGWSPSTCGNTSRAPGKDTHTGYLNYFWHIQDKDLFSPSFPSNTDQDSFGAFNRYSLLIACSEFGADHFWLCKEPKESLCLCVCVSVCPSVRLAQSCLKVSIFILEQSGSVSGQSQVSLRSVSGQSQVIILSSVSGQSQVSPRSLALWDYFVSKTEPKILRLVRRVSQSG